MNQSDLNGMSMSVIVVRKSLELRKVGEIGLGG
jgi:hypothetical protein